MHLSLDKSNRFAEGQESMRSNVNVMEICEGIHHCFACAATRRRFVS
jgi:hypothetical protein